MTTYRTVSAVLFIVALQQIHATISFVRFDTHSEQQYVSTIFWH